MFENEETLDPRLIDPNEPIEDLVARVRDRVLAVESDPNPDIRQRFENWREQRRTGDHSCSPRRFKGRFRFGQSARSMNAVLLVVAVGIVGVVVLIQVDGGRDSRDATSRSPATSIPVGDPASTTSKPRSQPALISTPAPMANVPAAWRSRCRDAPGLSRDAKSGWVCAATPEVTVEVLTFADSQRARTAFKTALARLAPRPAQGNAACVEVAEETATWSRHSKPDVTVGVFACGTTSRGAELIWTVNASNTMVRSVRKDGNLQRLFDWWDALGATSSPL